MILQFQADLFQLREALVCSYLLVDGDEVCLIDGGFLRGIRNISNCLSQLGLGWENITTILLTHGHLDHTYNLAKIQKRSGAKLYAHPLDAPHISGRYPYRGISRTCGLLQKCGRILFGFTAPQPTHALAHEKSIPFGGGIQVLHTPGHTEGHCCFHWLKRKTLFAGDLFATSSKRTFLPPSFLNSCPERYPRSLRLIAKHEVEGMLSNHCDKAPPKVQQARFLELASKPAFPGFAAPYK
ncbi:MBL fold metallo-hydrolase [Pelagicoccus sp. NFK12]|uniref:MBL fold metallo-hydrolase n=1 Tax=Pelagicoccus enzymogenes TaxID=2773457 RepID=A0A927IJC1_9BACT|nr:MBL fold metallo-hydrolase [Pelagicoccus enzymogenes]MBD5782176.1 MBL fold metallo-hydrolase [Pelagicoccus enzymogenes]